MGKTHMINELCAYHSTLLPNGRVGLRRPFVRMGGVLLNSCKEMEKTTPFYMWAAIFGELFSSQTLVRLAEASAAHQRTDADAEVSERFGASIRDGSRSARRRWKDAITTVLAYQCPGFAPDGEEICSIRPQADAPLLASPLLLQHAPLLSPVLPRPIEDNEFTKHLSGEARKDASINVMCHVLEAKLGGARTLLMFDDVQWMDSSSWALLEAMRKRVQPLLVVLTTRPNLSKGGLPAELAKMGDSKGGMTAELTELQRPDIDELMRAMLGVRGRVDVALSSTIQSRSGGNPLFAIGFVQSMQERGVLDLSQDRIELKDGLDVNSLEFPSSVETMITSRIDRLAVGEQMILKVAAVAAPAGFFTEEKMRPMLAAGGLEMPPGSTVKELLKSLRDVEMLSIDMGNSRPGCPAYSFKHVSVQSVAQSLLSIELKDKLHVAAAETIEATREGVADEDLQFEAVKLLAHHWKHAGSDDGAMTRALTYLRIAGDRALAQCSVEEANQLFLEALAIAEKLKSAGAALGPLRRRLGECHLMRNDYSHAKPLLEGALVSLGGETEPLSQMSETDARLKLTKMQLGRMWNNMSLKALFGTKQGMGPPPSAGEPLLQMETALAYELLYRVCMQDHNVALGGYCAMRALELGSQLENLTPVVARAYAALSLTSALLPCCPAALLTALLPCCRYAALSLTSALLPCCPAALLTALLPCCRYAALSLTSAVDMKTREAAEFRQLALSSCQQLGELGLLAYTLTISAVNEAGQGVWVSAVENIAKATKISHDLGDKFQEEEAVSQNAHLEFYRGNFGASKRLYEQVTESAAKRKDTKMVNRCAAGIAAVLLATGENSRALAMLEKTNSYGQLALALLRAGRPKEAYAMALKVTDRFKGRRTKYYVLKGFLSVAEVVLSLLESAIARAKAEHARSASSNKQMLPPARARRDSITGAGQLQRLATGVFGDKHLVARSRDSVVDEDHPDGRDSGDKTFEDADTLRAMAQEWIDKLSQFASVYAVANSRVLLFRGRLQLMSGNTSSAIKLARQSVAKAQAMSMPYDEALAKHFLGKHTKTLKLLVEAKEAFTRLGVAQPDES